MSIIFHFASAVSLGDRSTGTHRSKRCMKQAMGPPKRYQERITWAIQAACFFSRIWHDLTRFKQEEMLVGGLEHGFYFSIYWE